jgi:hypothetical protein
MRKKLTLEVVGREDGDLEFGLEEVLRLVKEGFTSGHNANNTGNFAFSIEDWPLQSAGKLVEKKARG